MKLIWSIWILLQQNHHCTKQEFWKKLWSTLSLKCLNLYSKYSMILRQLLFLLLYEKFLLSSYLHKNEARIHFPILQEPTQNSRRQKSNIKQIPYWGSKNLRYHRINIEFTRRPGIRNWPTPVVFSILTRTDLLARNSLAYLLTMFQEFSCVWQQMVLL